MRGFHESINTGARSALRDFNFSLVGKVVGTDNLKDGFIDVLPVTRYLDYSLNEVEYPTLYNVPIIYPNTSKSSITMPINQGDGVLLVFTQQSNEEYMDSDKEIYTPTSDAWLSLNHAVAFVGFNTRTESKYNPTQFRNRIDTRSVNIVHNINTDKEAIISIAEDGTISLKTDQVIKAESKSVEVVCENIKADCQTIDATSATIKTDGDVVIKGVSVDSYMKSHRHNYTDDGNLLVTDVGVL